MNRPPDEPTAPGDDPVTVPGPGLAGAGATISITVNGEQQEVAPGTSVADVVASLVPDPRGLAVAVDRQVVPRARWGTTVLEVGTSVEVVAAAAGG